MTSSTPTQPATRQLPVAVIGAGPIGLAAAAHLLARGETPVVFEAGPSVGASVRAWGHVRLFSPWRYLVDQEAVGLLEPTGWQMPDPEYLPTGNELVSQYLEPLAAFPEIEPVLRLGTSVQSISRLGLDKMKDAGRETAPFMLRVRTVTGDEEEIVARAVIDASGTWRTPNPLGADGRLALGEHAASQRIAYGIPDVLDRERARYAGKRVLVVGSGHSAFNTLLDLSQLAFQEPATSITWVVRRASPGLMFGGGAKDALPARGALGSRVEQLLASGVVRLVSLRIARLDSTADGVHAIGDDGTTLESVDEIVAATGFRPDLDLTRELRLALDPATESPTALAPLIDPNVHSCGTVYPHGAEELKHPEAAYYTVGMKSYGRAPTFLLLTGYEQVRSVVAALAGDWEAARKPELVLPETGVCSTDLSQNAAASCCGTSVAESTPHAVANDSLVLPVLDLAGTRTAPVEAQVLANGLSGSASAVTTCCSTEEQTTCCAPADKAACSGASELEPASACRCR